MFKKKKLKQLLSKLNILKKNISLHLSRNILAKRLFVSEKRLIYTPVCQLKVGMYISKLDRPWLETPFVFHGFKIININDVDEIAKHCRYVYVDATHDKSLVVRSKSEANTHEYSSVLVKPILDEIRLAESINSASTKKIVNNCVDSVVNNSGSLLWLSRMSKTHKGLESHALSCCKLSIGFGQHLSFSQERVEKLGTCALLHNVGLLKLPLDILEKALHHEQIDQATLQVMQQHTTYGRDILASNDAYWGAVDVAYCHHERYDGKGYPRGLKGTAIPLFASIISIIDTYEALTTPNGYKKPISSIDALRIIYQERGKQFDPALVKSFIRYIGLYPVGTIVQLKKGDIGVVIANNPYVKHLPTVMILLDAEQKIVQKTVLNLREIYKEAQQESFLIQKAFPTGSFGIDVVALIKDGIINGSGTRAPT